MLGEYRGFVFVGAVGAVLIIFYIALVIWEGGIQGVIESTVEEKNALLSTTRTNKVTSTREFARRARAIDGVVSAHNLPSQLLPLIEESSHNRIIFKSFHFDIDTQTLEIQGVAPTFEVMGEQFVIWKNAAVFAEKVFLDDFSPQTTGQISFTATLQIARAFLH